MEEAFQSGVADYLCDPWSETELAARVGRLLSRTALRLPRAEAVLRGTRLDGPRRSIRLSRDEAALLRILYREKENQVSRTALRRVLWPRLTENSRIVDETVSRLRKHLAESGISRSRMEICSLRGFGYQLREL